MQTRKRRKKQQYFGECEEQAVVDYINGSSSDRDRIYREILDEPFRKMVESILRRYPIYIGNNTMQEVEVSCLSHLIQKMVQFNPEKITKNGKKTKAFSYLQTIVRNYYRDHNKDSYKNRLRDLNFEDYSSEILNRDEYLYRIDDDDISEIDELIKIVLVEINGVLNTHKDLKKNEIIVGNAILEIFENWDTIFMEDTSNGRYDKKISNNFTKNKILLMLNDITELNTKEIRTNMRKFKTIYDFEKHRFYNPND